MRYAGLSAGLAAAMLVLFVLAEAWRVPFLADPEPLGELTGLLAALVGVALLVVDVVLPVPSSVVMITHGALFGIPLGTALSVSGSVGSFAVGFALGRRGAAVVARVVPVEDRAKADRILRRWGVVGIILSRPVPILAETVSFVAGASPLRWRPAVGAAALGYLPAAAVYATAGTVATSFPHGAAVFLGVVALAAATAVLVRKPLRSHAGPASRRIA